MVEYADIWVYPDHIEVLQQGRVTETIPIRVTLGESWRRAIDRQVVGQLRSRHWVPVSWHRPRANDAVLATTFAWRDRPQ